MDDATKLRQFVEGLRDRLTVRECQAATLCYLHDYTRPEAAVLLGVEPKRMDKIMDGVSKKVGEFVRAIEAGRVVPGARVAHAGVRVRRPGRGGAAPRRLAGDHLASCSPCRSYVRSLRGLSAALPPVALPVGAAGDGGAASVLDQLGELLDGAGGPLLRLVEETPGARARDGRRRGVVAGGGAAAGRGGGARGAEPVRVRRPAAQRRSWSRSWWPWRSPEAARQRWCATTAPEGRRRPHRRRSTPGRRRGERARPGTSGPLAERRTVAERATRKRARKPKRTKPARPARRPARAITIARTLPPTTAAGGSDRRPRHAPATAPATSAPAASPPAPTEFGFENG